MRWLFSPLLPLLFVAALSADTFVYVSKAPEKQIQIYKLDAKEGKLSPVDTLDVEGSPGALAVDPQKKFLFASLRTNESLASFRIDAATGKLKPINSVKLDKGANAAFVATDRTGRWLLSASRMLARSSAGCFSSRVPASGGSNAMSWEAGASGPRPSSWTC